MLFLAVFLGLIYFYIFSCLQPGTSCACHQGNFGLLLKHESAYLTGLFCQEFTANGDFCGLS